MTFLIYIIIFFFIFIVFFGLSIIRGIFRFLFGNSGSNNNQNNNNRQQSSTKWYYSKKKKKVFDKSDGEYVEFEEIKEEEKKESNL